MLIITGALIYATLCWIVPLLVAHTKRELYWQIALWHIGAAVAVAAVAVYMFLMAKWG